MNDAYSYRILPERHLVIAHMTGDIRITDIKSMMAKISTESDYLSTYDMVTDFRDCILIIDPDEISEYVNYLQLNLGIISRRKTALLTNSPNKVALTTLFSEEVIKLGMQPKVFSTIDAIVYFLKKEGLDKPYLEKIINDLIINPT